MVVWSSLAARVVTTQCRNVGLYGLNIVPRTGFNHIQVRTCKSPGGEFRFVPSSFQWNKFKDIINFYLLIGLLPALGIIFYANIFIGPATLKPIPEGYKPKPWEYHSHPITRFLAKYVTKDPQKEYEKMCFYKFYCQEEKYARRAEKQVKALIAERRDYQSWYYSPAMTKYARRSAKFSEEVLRPDMDAPLFPQRN